jgi:hypothetical protein
MERAVADLPTYKAGDAADLKSELIKAGGSALVKLLLKRTGYGNWRPCPQRGRKVIVNLFKAGHTAARELQGITLVSICRKMFTNMLRKRMSPKCTCTRLRRRSEAKILHRQLVRAHAHPPRGWQGQQNCLCVLSGRKAYGLEGWAIRQVARERCGWKVMAGPARPSY